MCATDTQCLVDNGHRGRCGFGKWNKLPTEQIGKTSHRVFAARRAKIDGRLTLDNGGGVRATPRIAALRALCLWKKIIDLFHEVAVAGRKSSRRETEANARNKGDGGDC